MINENKRKHKQKPFLKKLFLKAAIKGSWYLKRDGMIYPALISCLYEKRDRIKYGAGQFLSRLHGKKSGGTNFGGKILKI